MKERWVSLLYWQYDYGLDQLCSVEVLKRGIGSFIIPFASLLTSF
jgi:hypothetical protein